MPTFLSDIGLPRDGDALTEAVTRAYVQEQMGTNQWVNGYGGYGTNYNFEAFTAGGQYAYLGKVGFSYTGAYINTWSPLQVVVDTSMSYRISAWTKAIGTPAPQYIYTTASDVDGNSISSFMGNTALHYTTTQTTLAATWTPPAATMSLTNGSAWVAQNTNANRNLLIYPYTNAAGYTYPNYQYSRHNCGGAARWTVSGNTLTLTNPSDPALRSPAGDGSWPAGTPIMACTYGGTYMYPWFGTPTNSWQNVSGRITPPGLSGTSWWYGTSLVTLGFLLNYGSTGQVIYSGLRFEVDSAEEIAIQATQPSPPTDLWIDTDDTTGSDGTMGVDKSYVDQVVTVSTSFPSGIPTRDGLLWVVVAP